MKRSPLLFLCLTVTVLTGMSSAYAINKKAFKDGGGEIRPIRAAPVITQSHTPSLTQEETEEHKQARQAAEEREQAITNLEQAVQEAPHTYAGYQRASPLLWEALRVLTRGDEGFEQNIHDLYDSIYGKFGRLLTDGLWYVVREEGEADPRPLYDAALRDPEAILRTFNQQILGNERADFLDNQIGEFSSWRERALSSQAGVGLFHNIRFVELLDLICRLYQTDNDRERAENLKEKICFRIDEMLRGEGGCSSGSFWRLLPEMVISFQDELGTLEEAHFNWRHPESAENQERENSHRSLAEEKVFIEAVKDLLSRELPPEEYGNQAMTLKTRTPLKLIDDTPVEGMKEVLARLGHIEPVVTAILTKYSGQDTTSQNSQWGAQDNYKTAKEHLDHYRQMLMIPGAQNQLKEFLRDEGFTADQITQRLDYFFGVPSFYSEGQYQRFADLLAQSGRAFTYNALIELAEPIFDGLTEVAFNAMSEDMGV